MNARLFLYPSSGDPCFTVILFRQVADDYSTLRTGMNKTIIAEIDAHMVDIAFSSTLPISNEKDKIASF